jgi:hypothetical protein
VIAVGGLVLGIVLVLVVFVLAVPSLTESGKVEVKLGPDRFDAGSAEDQAAEIAENGPILFSDVAGKQRDIYLQHVGSDAHSGWLAFDAREPGASRDCFLEWRAETGQFVDRCDGSTVNATGDGLTQYSVEVTDGGRVVIDLRE